MRSKPKNQVYISAGHLISAGGADAWKPLRHHQLIVMASFEQKVTGSPPSS